MSFEGLRPVTDASVGDWIAPRLRGFGGRVNQVVPDGFAAYVRIFHPAEVKNEEPVTWAEVCRRLGRTAHALMQWTSIAGVVNHARTAGRWPRRRSWIETTSEWPGEGPWEGNAPPQLLESILTVVGATTDGAAVHGVWDGWGWAHPGATVRQYGRHKRGRSFSRPLPWTAPEDMLGAARLEHPGRDYPLFEGPLAAALTIGKDDGSSIHPQSPNLLWPADRSWCLATEVDFDSTLIGGPTALMDALLAEPALEVWPVQPSDDLTHEGDRINR